VPPPPSRPPGLAAGAAAPFRGIGFVLRNPRLLVWVIVPVLLVGLLAALLAIAGFAWAAGLAPAFAGPWAAGLDWARGPVRWLAAAGVRLAGALAGVLAALSLAGAVAAPFLELLSEGTEAAALGIREPGRPWSAFLGDALRGAAAALLLLGVQVLVMTPLFLLSFFAVGAPLFTAAGAWFAGFGAADVVLGRKRTPGAARLAWAGRRWAFLLGLGAPVAFVPVLLPFAVVGATLAVLADPEKGPAARGGSERPGDPALR
jgi:CysZ protein